MNSSKKPNKEPKKPKIEKSSTSSHKQVLVIAAIGFVIGVAWPRLAGVSLVPEAPVDSEDPETEVLEDEQAPVQEPEVIELTPEDRLNVSPVQITSCVKDDDKSKKCDEIEVDELVHNQLIALLGCPSASGVFGTLSLGFKLDFKKGKIHDVESGRSTDLPESTTKELLRCASDNFSAVSLNKLKHEFDEYQVYYLLEFKTPEAAAQEKTAVTPASGKATVQWRTALIRKEPDRDAKVVARLLTGALVVVSGRMGEWYRVKFDDKGREGWVHGNAIGLKTE